MAVKATPDKKAAAANPAPPDRIDPTTASMAAFLQESGLAEEFSQDKSLTFNIWEPEEGEVRAFKFNGMEDRTGIIEGKETTFQIHYGIDLKTGEEFSFIGGGLFSYIMNEKKVEKGTPLIACYQGMADIDNNQRAKQWVIKLLAPGKSK